MLRVFAAAALFCAATLPQNARAATFVMADQRDDSAMCDRDSCCAEYNCFLSGRFDATDGNRDGYITTEEVESFNAWASVEEDLKGGGYEWLLTANNTNEFDRFEIRYKIGDVFIENLRFTSHDYVLSCASVKFSGGLDIELPPRS
jgi:hypothetical protein